eukprot:NODE_322_length_11016_cov_0.249061.p1 type:complete len:675 gc:universal NODE_322_length_11016_cov_0.249061:7669-5645(-)
MPTTNKNFGMMYQIISRFFIMVVSIFFREVKSRGSHYIPSKGPVIFSIAPHHNQFVDPFVVLKTATRPVSFLIAKASLRRKLVGMYANWMNSIGVERPQDITKPGTGQVMIRSKSFNILDSDSEFPQVLESLETELRIKLFGYDTKFTNYKLKGVILIGKNSFTIVEIIDDGTVLVDCKVKDWLAIFDKPLSFKYQEPTDYDDMYSSVSKHLASGNCLGIFPEGGSHDQSELLPMKAGIAIMALTTLSEYPSCGLKIVPCGLSYFHADRFRSRAVVEFGVPFEVPVELIEMYKTGGSMKREACGKLLEMIVTGVRNVTVTAPDYQTLEVLQAVRRMYTPLNQKLTMVQKLELTRRLMKGYIQHMNDERIKTLTAKVLSYNESLSYYGLRDHQVEKTAISRNRAIYLMSFRLCLLLTYTVFAVPFILLNLPIAVIASILSQRKADEAKNNSTVKLWGRDVQSTWKILFGLVLLAIFYSIYSLAFFILQLRKGIALLLSIKYTIYFTVALPFGTYCALRLGETGLDIYKSLKPLWYVIFPKVFYYQPTKKLREMRKDLYDQVNYVINELGPSLFPDFKIYFLTDKHLEDEVAASQLGLHLNFLSGWPSGENLIKKLSPSENAWELVDKKDFDKATSSSDLLPGQSVIQSIAKSIADDDVLEITSSNLRKRIGGDST